MGIFEGAKNAAKRFHDTWISPRDEPQTGEVYIKTPDGKTTVSASLSGSRDAQKIKAIVNILFPDTVISPEEYFSIGRTDE